MSANSVAMPRLGMTMEEGTVVDWPVAVGGAVVRSRRGALPRLLRRRCHGLGNSLRRRLLRG